MFFHLVREHGAWTSEVLDPGCQELLRFDLGEGERLVLMGDPVFRDRNAFPDVVLGEDGMVDPERLFLNVPGHYYWFHWIGDRLECGSSFCAMHPVHHRQALDRSDVSSSSFHIARTHRLAADDRGYLLERRLFHYPLFDRTPWTSIRLLPTNARLIVEADGARIDAAFQVSDHFGDGSRGGKAAMDELCGLFMQECDIHMPHDGFALSFTGGFDGRTLLGAALKLGRRGFSTYGFGRPGESDIALPEVQSRVLGVPYTPILLDDDYLREHAFSSAVAFMELSDHAGNLGRPHYHYAAKLLSGSNKYLITGNFGSELFRAMHHPGVMMSQHLIDLFADSEGAWQGRLVSAAGPDFRTESAILVREIEAYFAGAASLSPTHRFYRFVMDGIFRKYFGPEIIVQSRFLRNRTPFLSLRFIQALNRTVWSGVHARLFEGDRTRRRVGQVFYANFLRKADRRLYRMPTNKGYAPPDVIEPWRMPLLAFRFAVKYFFRRERADSNSIGAFLDMYRERIIAHFRPEDDAALRSRGDEGSELQDLANRVAWSAARAVGSPE